MSILIAFLLTLIALCNSNILPFKKIKISVNGNHIRTMTLKNIITQNIDGGFFSLNVSALQLALLSIPWVDNVSLRRVWPNKLEIVIQEQQPIACWDNNALITAEGKIFSPPSDTIPKNLPHLQGPDDSVSLVLKCFRHLNQELMPLSVVVITALTLSNRYAWSLTLNTHTKVYLGRENIDQRFKQLVHLYPSVISSHENQIDHIDLRYPNGLAIQ
ncbi:cell division protein FtsQ/DivIB [Coxiella endosymbiont of Amblyomma nuttalli]|uniref:cell division protein FtsQ/DivIB n=1 Tax=Coxiella endosymbiont of Amblyomma nuttalli TaxID=2749996 RepID=UPI001BB68D87|nr:cell division protein FtsQ/DivIB [Coxiella endosymbiont of Amblyomma nuttalli]QTS83759.1 Cell division protein FtsQ [Coxiella endosymbiont of Amblyomma nuttalli]